MRKLKPRNFTIDGKPYAVSISAGEIDREQDVHLHVAFRALFGNRSVCLVRGLTNRSFWHDYPAIEEMREKSISITPKIVCDLVRLARRSGWSPESCKSNFEFLATKDDIRVLSASDDDGREP